MKNILIEDNKSKNTWEAQIGLDGCIQKIMGPGAAGGGNEYDQNTMYEILKEPINTMKDY